MIYNVPDFNPYIWQHYCMHHLTHHNVITAPRQHGKTSLMCELINTVAMAPHITNPIINLCSDTAKRLYKLYGQRLNDLFKHNPLWSWTKDDQGSSRVLRPDGSYTLINFIGSVANPDGCAGTPAHLNIIDEAALVSKYFIFNSAMPATDKTEGFTIVTGTVANNQYKDIYDHGTAKMLAGDPNWFTFYMRFGDEWSRKSLSDSARNIIYSRYDLTKPEDKLIWDTQYMCDWDAGSAEGKPYALEVGDLQRQNRVLDIPLNDGALIGTYLGYSIYVRLGCRVC